MEKYFKIFFKRNSDIASNPYAKYQKEEIYRMILKAYRTGNAKLESTKQENDIVYQHYEIKKNKYTMFLEIIMYSDDIYIKKLEKVRKKYRKNPFTKMLAILGISFVLYSLLPELKVNLNDSNSCDIFDELFTSYLEEDFDHNLDMVNNLKNEKWLSNSREIYEESKENIDNIKISKSIEPVIHALSSSDLEHISDTEIFYDFENNNFNKKTLSEKIQENSVSRDNVSFLEYELLNDIEYEILFNQLYNYIELLKKEYPDIDLTHFICNLSTLSFYKSSNFENKNNVYASFYPWYVVYNSKMDEFVDLNTYIKVNFHEFFHINQSYCVCEFNNNVLVVGNSLYLYNGVIYDDDVIDLQPYYHTFLLEGCAEKGASNLLNETPSTYLAENEVLDTLEFALMVNPRYQMNTMFYTNIYRNPLEFYSSLPYIYNEKEELIDYIEMLECYDYCFKNDIKEYLGTYSVNSEYETLENKDISINNSFLYYSRMKHIELFYKNLFYLNESSNENLFEYDLFLMHLFEELMRKQENNISNYKNPYLDSILEDGSNMFIEYLSKKYKIDYDTIYDIYLNFDIYSFEEYPNVVEEEKINFIKMKLKNLKSNIYEGAPNLIKE